MSLEPISMPGVVEFPARTAASACDTHLAKYRLEDFDALEGSASSWRVKGLWPAVGVAFVGGPSMSGKSFWTLDALAKVCRGEPVLGRKSTAAGVIYVAAEGANGARTRLQGLRGKSGTLDGQFLFIGQSPNLMDRDDVAALRAVLLDGKRQIEERGSALGVVAIDTLSAAIPGADENSAQHMSQVLADLQGLATDLGVLVLIVAHTGKDESRGLRGWSGLLANADGVIMLDDPKGDATRSGTVTKVKDGSAGDTFAFELDQVRLGLDADGDPITTCVVRDVESIERRTAGRKPTKAGASAALIMRAYSRVIEAKPHPINAPGAIGCAGVLVSDLRAQAYMIGLSPSEPDYSELGNEADRKRAKRAWQDKRKIDFDRGLQHLAAAKAVRIEGDLVWEPRAKDHEQGNGADEGERN